MDVDFQYIFFLISENLNSSSDVNIFFSESQRSEVNLEICSA